MVGWYVDGSGRFRTRLASAWVRLPLLLFKQQAAHLLLR